jgi:hypothetical protein
MWSDKQISNKWQTEKKRARRKEEEDRSKERETNSCNALLQATVRYSCGVTKYNYENGYRRGIQYGWDSNHETTEYETGFSVPKQRVGGWSFPRDSELPQSV